MFPLNQSVSRDGAVKAYYVKEADRLWPKRLSSSHFELIEDSEASGAFPLGVQACSIRYEIDAGFVILFTPSDVLGGGRSLARSLWVTVD